MSEPQSGAEQMPLEDDREAYLVGLARLLMDKDALVPPRSLVLEPLLLSLPSSEQDVVFHWCEVWSIETKSYWNPIGNWP